MDDRDELIARLRSLDCVMVEVCEPHSGNPSPNIIPISRADLLAAFESRPAPTELPGTCDGIEQDAFEAWAEANRFDMQQHPLHWLFLNSETNAARQGWRAGLTHAVERIKATLATDTTPSRDARLLEGQIPPFLSAPDFDDRSEQRVCINGCLYLRADFAAERFSAPSRDEEGSVDREAAVVRLRRHLKGPPRCPDYSPYHGSPHSPESDLALLEAALKTSTPETQTVEGGEQPVVYVSFGQLEAIVDRDGEGGTYLPVRKSSAGNFITPLYTQPPKPTPERSMALEEAIAENEAARREVLTLIEGIWKAEFRHEAPNWKPLPDLVGMISQLDNMYAGVRGQRDEARWKLAALSASPIEVEK